MQRLTAGVRRGARVTIIVDEAPLDAYAGESVAAALLAAGRRILRRTPKAGAPRGLFCGMGVCFDCVLRVDGVANVRACLTPVRDGMRIDTGMAGHVR
jgi:predicted molibdopterin-dependent oxidoreductase YjgC